MTVNPFESVSVVPLAGIDDVYFVVSPRSDHFLELLCGMGYSLSAVIAGLIDDTTTVGVRNIWFLFHRFEKFCLLVGDGPQTRSAMEVRIPPQAYGTA